MSLGYLILSISVPEVLGEGSNISEVLWNFSRFKDPEHRLTLDQNPHFYKELPQEYGADFQCDPIHNFLDTPGHKIFVLTDRPSWIWLESGQVSRAFGNVWCPQNAIIFKGSSESSLVFSIFANAHFGTSVDVCGKLEGEGIVGSSIRAELGLRWSVERLTSPSKLNPMDQPEPLEDWREPIRRLLESSNPDVCNIHIGTDLSSLPKRRRVCMFSELLSSASGFPIRADLGIAPTFGQSQPNTT